MIGFCPIINSECVNNCVFANVDKNNKIVCLLNEVLWNVFLKQTGARPVEKILWENNDNVSV